jgi:hypothetical protein
MARNNVEQGDDWVMSLVFVGTYLLLASYIVILLLLLTITTLYGYIAYYIHL